MPHSSISMLLWLCLLCCGLAEAATIDKLSKANNAFAFELYKKIGDANIGKNLFFSPISISTAFGMVNLGARGKSREQSKAVLHLNKMSSNEAMKDGYKQLLTALRGQADNYTLHLVNRLFGSNTFDFHQKFLRETQNYFEASMESLDFVGNPEESRRHINQWVEEQTNQKIKDILPSGGIHDKTVLLIVNAIYFNALWVTPFPKVLTKSGPFRISKSERNDMDMMHLSNKFLNYYKSQILGCKVLELPYQGNKTSMFVFLPHDVEGLPDLEKKLTGGILADTLRKVKGHNMVVQLPKFVMEQSISLKKFLQAMGMVDLFDEVRADLSGVGRGRLVVTDAIQKAFVDVSESGTEAAAATSVGIRFTSARKPPPLIPFIVDRPFLFLIYEKSTKSVLFMGRLVRPPTA